MVTVIVLLSLFAAPEGWPVLPMTDGAVVIPAQEWPREAGPRTVKVYVRYPGGGLDSVDESTGLFLNLHNWGGTDTRGAIHPKEVVNRYNVVSVSLDYLQSGAGKEDDPPYDFGYLQGLDALRALYFVFSGLDARGIPFARGRIFAAGGSGGGNVSLMANKLAPRTFACIVDISGMARLSDDIAFYLPGGSKLDARYSSDPESPRYLSADAQAIRFVGHAEHLRSMHTLGNRAKIVVVHGVDDASCLVQDAREMAASMQSAGLGVEPHFITKGDIDGKAVKTTGHSLGDRTLILHRFAGAYLAPEGPASLSRQGPCDFERREEVHYGTPNGRYSISYEEGYPRGRFERHSPAR